MSLNPTLPCGVLVGDSSASCLAPRVSPPPAGAETAPACSHRTPSRLAVTQNAWTGQGLASRLSGACRVARLRRCDFRLTEFPPARSRRLRPQARHHQPVAPVLPDASAPAARADHLHFGRLSCSGYSGYTTRDVLPIAKDLFGSTASDHQKISFITLFLGANDATLFGAQHVRLGLTSLAPSPGRPANADPSPSTPPRWRG